MSQLRGHEPFPVAAARYQGEGFIFIRRHRYRIHPPTTV